MDLLYQITGGQAFIAHVWEPMHELPLIWEELIAEGFERVRLPVKRLYR